MAFEDQHLISDSEFVTCMICGKKYTLFGNRHLKKEHKTTLEEYKKIYPNEPTITKEAFEKELISIQNRKIGKKKIENKVKNVPCYFHPDRIITVNINSSKTNLCDECKENGKILPWQKEAVEKSKKTIKEKYGVENASHLKEVVEKRKIKWDQKTEEEKEEIVKKRENTIIEKFGSDWGKELHKLSEEGLLKKYGFRHALEVEEFKNKFKETFSKKSKEEKEEIVQKVKKTKKERYGDEKYINLEKIQQTNKILYGGISPFSSKEVVERREQNRNLRMALKIRDYLKIINLELLDEKYLNCYHRHNFRCMKCGFEFAQLWNSIQQGFTCPNCRPFKSGANIPETILQNFIKTFDFKNVSFSNRALIFPWELDIVIHDLKIAIEYNGLYYHNDEILRETRKLKDPKYYHAMKREFCLEKGYRLITIFEDEWVFKNNIVLSRLGQILGRSKTRIHGRECIISEISKEEKNKFLEEYHIQGQDSSIIKLGAFYKNELVSVMTFSKGSETKENIWQLNRFCSSSKYHIPEISEILLEYFKRKYTWFKIYTYVDLRWSTGNLYRKLGFSCEEKIRLNYWYVDTNKIKRIDRFTLRKRPDEPKDIPEYVLRIAEGYKIIWDCGNLKFYIKNN